MQAASPDYASQPSREVPALRQSADSVARSLNTPVSEGPVTVEETQTLALRSLQSSHEKDRRRHHHRHHRHHHHSPTGRGHRPTGAQPTGGPTASQAAPTATPAAVALPGLYIQVYSPYTSESLPIPASSKPSSVGSVPNISYPDVNNSALFTVAGAATSFALKFLGELRHTTSARILTVHKE